MSTRCTLLAVSVTCPCCCWWGPPLQHASPGSQPTPACASVCRYNDQNKRSIANQYHEVMASATNKYLGGFSRVVVIIALVSSNCGRAAAGLSKPRALLCGGGQLPLARTALLGKQTLQLLRCFVHD